MPETTIPHEQKRCPHPDTEGGVSTNFDPYGTRKKLGLSVEEWQHICWPCYNEWGEEKDKVYRSQTDLAARETDHCGFLEAWVGHCANQEPCPKHSSQQCRCGSPATHNCSNTGTLVCGAPLCDEHKCSFHGD